MSTLNTSVLPPAIKNIYMPVLDTMTDIPVGVKIMMISQAIKEGFIPPSGNNKGSVSFRSNNPGNVGTSTNPKNYKITTYPTLRAGIYAQFNNINRIKTGLHTQYPLKGNTTVKGFLSKYAPASDGNNEGAYLTFVKSFYQKQGYPVSNDTTVNQLFTMGIGGALNNTNGNSDQKKK